MNIPFKIELFRTVKSVLAVVICDVKYILVNLKWIMIFNLSYTFSEETDFVKKKVMSERLCII